MKRRVPKQIPVHNRILIICEGVTEFTYLQDLLQTHGYDTVHIEQVQGGGFSHFLHRIYMRQLQYSVILVVADLDIVQMDPAQRVFLEEVIKTLSKASVYNALFLSFPSIEYWFSLCTPEVHSHWKDAFKNKGYKKGTAVLQFLQKTNASYLNGVLHADATKVFYDKPQAHKRHRLHSKYIATNHSNLYSLLDYLAQLRPIG